MFLFRSVSLDICAREYYSGREQSATESSTQDSYSTRDTRIRGIQSRGGGRRYSDLGRWGHSLPRRTEIAPSRKSGENDAAAVDAPSERNLSSAPTRINSTQ